MLKVNAERLIPKQFLADLEKEASKSKEGVKEASRDKITKKPQNHVRPK